ncbi:MAG: hypothetical protein EP338_10215 [Bacteroidetes bacterium]|nr:MAG: hypothetical protein EP338_10215 [Bacteroidota bacterium]
MKIPISLLFCLLFIMPKAQETVEHRIYFETASATWSETEKTRLANFWNSQFQGGVESVQVLAYCDDRGSVSYNKKLAERRLESAMNYFREKGFKAFAQADTVAVGELSLKGNASEKEEERKENRRVSIILTMREESPPPVVVEPEPIPEEVLEKPKEKVQQIFTENTKVGDKIVLENILFEGGRHYILPESEPSLRHLLKTLKDHPKYHVVILGHICCQKRGMDGYDYDTGRNDLSEARAEVIYRFLVANGVDAKRLSHKGMKSDYKLGKGDKYDRRVEIEVTKIVEE